MRLPIAADDTYASGASVADADMVGCRTVVGVTVPAIAMGDGTLTPSVTAVAVSAAAGMAAPPASVDDADMIVPADMVVGTAVGVVVPAAATGDTAVNAYGVGESSQSDGDITAGMGFGAIALGDTMAADRGATAGIHSRRDGLEGTGFSPPKRRNGSNSAARRTRKCARHDSSKSRGDPDPWAPDT